jgi:hypothetical protein
MAQYSELEQTIASVLTEDANDAGAALQSIETRILEYWKKQFPHSGFAVRTGNLSGPYKTFSFYLAKDSSEAINKIIQNDPLSFSVGINENTDGTFAVKWYTSSFTKNPESKYLVYSTQKVGQRSSSSVDADKAVAIVAKGIDKFKTSLVQAVADGDLSVYHEKLPFNIVDKLK